MFCVRSYATRAATRASRRPLVGGGTAGPSAAAVPSIPKQSVTGRPRSRVPLYVGGLLLYGTSIYVGSLAYRIYHPSTTSSPSSGPVIADDPTHDSNSALSASRPEVYDRIAARYDADIQLDETLMGLTWLRWWLVSPLAGDVLEVSAGTGRNLSHYDPDKLRSLTLVDRSGEMLDVARERYRDLVARDAHWRRRTAAAPAEVEVVFKDVALEGLSPNRHSYDVVLQSFGLCSVSHPTAFLSHLAQFCRADGEIILLEHGRGKYAWLNRILDSTVGRHAETWGCFYNRDIQAIVENCPEVEVVSLERWHFGTTYVYRLRPKVQTTTTTTTTCTKD